MGSDKVRRLVTLQRGGRVAVRPMPVRAAIIARRQQAAAPEGEPDRRLRCPTLISKDSLPVRGDAACYGCDALGPVRQYEALAVGRVLLCPSCAERSREDSFGRRDALDRASRGGFETSRRRH